MKYDILFYPSHSRQNKKKMTFLYQRSYLRRQVSNVQFIVLDSCFHRNDITVRYTLILLLAQFYQYDFAV